MTRNDARPRPGRVRLRTRITTAMSCSQTLASYPGPGYKATQIPKSGVWEQDSICYGISFLDDKTSLQLGTFESHCHYQAEPIVKKIL